MDKNKLGELSVSYDLFVALIVFIVSLSIMLTTDSMWLIYTSIMSIASLTVYCLSSARFLELCSTEKDADIAKKISTFSSSIMFFFFVVELIVYGVQYGL